MHLDRFYLNYQKQCDNLFSGSFYALVFNAGNSLGTNVKVGSNLFSSYTRYLRG